MILGNVEQSKTTKIHIYEDEYWPFYGLAEGRSPNAEVPNEQLERWQSVMKEFSAVQAEMASWPILETEEN